MISLKVVFYFIYRSWLLGTLPSVSVFPSGSPKEFCIQVPYWSSECHECMFFSRNMDIILVNTLILPVFWIKKIKIPRLFYFINFHMLNIYLKYILLLSFVGCTCETIKKVFTHHFAPEFNVISYMEDFPEAITVKNNILFFKFQNLAVTTIWCMIWKNHQEYRKYPMTMQSQQSIYMVHAVTRIPATADWLSEWTMNLFWSLDHLDRKCSMKITYMGLLTALNVNMMKNRHHIHSFLIWVKQLNDWKLPSNKTFNWVLCNISVIVHIKQIYMLDHDIIHSQGQLQKKYTMTNWH